MYDDQHTTQPTQGDTGSLPVFPKVTQASGLGSVLSDWLPQCGRTDLLATRTPVWEPASASAVVATADRPAGDRLSRLTGDYCLRAHLRARPRHRNETAGLSQGGTHPVWKATASSAILASKRSQRHQSGWTQVGMDAGHNSVRLNLASGMDSPWTLLPSTPAASGSAVTRESRGRRASSWLRPRRSYPSESGLRGPGVANPAWANTKRANGILT